MSNIDDLLSESQVIELHESPPIRIVHRTQMIVIDPITEFTYVTNAGPQGPPGADSTVEGPKGDKGDKGDQGDPGIGSQWYDSPGPVTVWQIPNPFDHNPSVEVRDTTDRVCIAPVQFIPGFVVIDITPSNISLRAKLTP